MDQLEKFTAFLAPGDVERLAHEARLRGKQLGRRVTKSEVLRDLIAMLVGDDPEIIPEPIAPPQPEPEAIEPAPVVDELIDVAPPVPEPEPLPEPEPVTDDAERLAWIAKHLGNDMAKATQLVEQFGIDRAVEKITRKFYPAKPASSLIADIDEALKELS